MEQVYLSRRNLLTLLAKLNKVVDGYESRCTLIKCDTEHEKYPSSSKIIVTAVEDADYYTDREPGLMVEDLEAPSVNEGDEVTK